MPYNIVYDNPVDYLNSAGSDLKTRITRLTTIITNLENATVNLGSGGAIQNYSFNDGQSQINTNYRTLKDLTDAILSFETLRERLINRAKGRITVLRDQNTI